MQQGSWSGCCMQFSLGPAKLGAGFSMQSGVASVGHQHDGSGTCSDLFGTMPHVALTLASLGPCCTGHLP